jgi:hypothetical protein
MKRVVKYQEDIVFINNVNPNKFYGFLCDGYKGFITREKYNDGNFIILSITKLTEGNRWPLYKSNTLFSLINDFSEEYHKVYEFETVKELFNWLAID